MKLTWHAWAWSLALVASALAEETLVQRLWAGYERVESLTCELRRDTTSPAGTVRTLSRIAYQRPDRLNVENVTPLPRRIVADGRRFFSYIQGDPKGFSRPIEDLDEEMLINLRKVPGTAMDHLWRLREAPEEPLEPEEAFPTRRGYAVERVYAVLSLDVEGRLARLELYTAPDRETKTAQYDYSEFREVAPDVWIPCLHQAVFNLQGIESREEVRLDRLAVNEPIPPERFEADGYFQGVAFVDNFLKIYPR